MKFNKTIKISDFVVSENSKTFIIAEAGVNHGGDVGLAKKLIDIAASSGADAVKFQAFRTENLIIENIDKAPYQKTATGNKESQADMLRKLELRKEAYVELLNYCSEKKILFLITPFDEVSLQELEEIGVKAYKIASTDTTNLPFLKKIAKTGKPIILSTGMCYLEEVREAVKIIYEYNKDLILLQCTANYPIEDSEANLNVIRTFQQEFDAIIGYSDHSVGVGAAPYAVPMGAKVIEKHFTLDKSMDGPDHLASLDPKELKEFVSQIRKIETYMGGFVKEPTKAEKETKKSLQKCLVATTTIKQGESFTEENIVGKRTGGKGISPLKYKALLNLKATKDYQKNQIIEEIL
jgi:N,N'-diacetyllegionaminate synthase